MEERMLLRTVFIIVISTLVSSCAGHTLYVPHVHMNFNHPPVTGTKTDHTQNHHLSTFHPYSLETLKRKNFLSPTPRSIARNPFSFALNDSAEALVLRLTK